MGWKRFIATAIYGIARSSPSNFLFVLELEERKILQTVKNVFWKGYPYLIKLSVLCPNRKDI